MALRKTTHFVVFALLVILTGGTSTRAQEGNTSRTIFKDRISTPRESEPGSRQLTIMKGRPSQLSVAGPASTDFPPPKYKTSGKEFFVVFPSIIGNEPVANDPARRSLYLSSRGRTRVRVACDRRGWFEDVVTVPGKVTVVELPNWAGLRQSQFENVFDLGFTVTAEDDICVSAYSHESLSSDAFLILPKEALGQHYVVASQRNSLNYSGSMFDPFTPRSTFVMMATEDNTLITFKLTALSQSGRLFKDSIYSIILNRGELYPIMARDTGVTGYETYQYTDLDGNVINLTTKVYKSYIANADCDLTGSQVWSDKPIAVYSGHERASTPDVNEFDMNRILHDPALGISRDHLTEQMPPVELWGSEFFVMSSVDDRLKTRPSGGDVVRVMSATDGNIVAVNGVAVATVNTGKYYQFMSNELAHVTTTQPALVVKYMQSMMYRANESEGDPDMTVVPPVSNLSTDYTLPIVNNNLVFREPFVNILVHDDGLSSLRVNGKPPQSRAKKITGTNWTWYTEWGSPGEWRIECALPCYAESYAYGYADSYTFAGGGDFKYQDSLFAEDLDFKTLLVGRTKQMTANVKAGFDLNLLADSITLYDITWLSGDTDYFTMFKDVPFPIKLGPGDKLPVRFEFHPTEVKTYTAKAWVWSSSRALVYINVIGAGGLMTVEITPTDIDFGRVRVGTEVSAPFNVRFGGDDNLARVTLLASTYPDLKSAKLGFDVPDVPEGEWETNTAYKSAVKFKPMTEGYRDSGFSVYAHLPQSSPDVSEKLHVRLRGRGVQPNVVTEDMDYGEIRINRMSAYREIEIKNIGSDTTAILSVQFESGDVDDFTLEAASLPPANFVLDTTDVVGSHYRFRARFNPKDSGYKSVRIKITTLEGSIYSTLTGRGVEPYVEAIPPVVDFGTIDGSKPVVNPTKIFTIRNRGTYEAILNKLQRTEEGQKHFILRPLTGPLNIVDETLPKNESIDVEVTFLVQAVGDYIDTVFVLNDTRYETPSDEPLVILKARVKTDLVVTPPILNFDTIRNCDPVEMEITIKNTNSVEVAIDTIFFAGDANGFSFGGETVFKPENIRIAPGSVFQFKVKYVFPKELLSGDQHAKLVIYQLTGDEMVKLEINLEVYRSIRTLSLLTAKPAYTPNVSDAEAFQLPITITGGHEGLTEFDNFTLNLKFDNDLFKPVGTIQKGTLTETAPGEGSVSYVPYDPVTRTFTIRGENLQVSKRKGDLLIIVLVRALLTTDTVAVVTPELNLDQRPCAYAVSKHGIQLEYANDCGDLLLRDKLRDKLAFKILSATPDPLVTSSNSSIRFNYAIGYDAELVCEVLNTSGAVVTRLDPIQALAGQGTIEVPAEALPATGMYVLRVTQLPTTLGASGSTVYSHTFRAIR
jgi:hypothetical protein